MLFGVALLTKILFIVPVHILIGAVSPKSKNAMEIAGQLDPKF